MSRSRMILLSPLIALLASGSATVHGQGQGAGRATAPRSSSTPPAARATQSAPARPQPANDPVKMKWLLGKWAEQSAKLKTLDVHIYRIDKDPKWKDEVHFEGRAVFKSPNLAYLDFKKVKLTRDEKGQLAPAINPKDGKPDTTPTETIVCGRNEVWQYLYDGRQIFVYPLAKGERQRALDEGPLPFLFNMNAHEAEQRYEMLFLEELPKHYAVKVYPRLQEDKESFKAAFLYLDKEYLLPSRIALVTPDGRSIRDFRLHDIRANKPVDDVIFRGGIPAKGGWKVVQKAADRVPQQGNAAGRPGGAGVMPRR